MSAIKDQNDLHNYSYPGLNNLLGYNRTDLSNVFNRSIHGKTLDAFVHDLDF